MKTKRKISPLTISPFFCPKLGEEQKKSSSPRFCPLVCLNFLPKFQRGKPCRNFPYYSMLIVLFWQPKGGGHGTMLPLNTALDTRLEAKAKKHKKIRGQGQLFRGQTLSRPRTGMLEAKDTGASVLWKKKGSNLVSVRITSK